MKKRRLILLLLPMLLFSAACATLAPGGPLFATPTSLPTLTFTPAAPTPTAQVLPTNVSSRPEPRATHDPAAGPAPTREPPRWFFDEYLPDHVQVAETEHFIFYTNGDGYLPVDLERWKLEAEVIYAYVAERVQAESSDKVAIGFLPPQQQECPIRGMAAQGDPPSILIYADQNSPEPYLFAVLAHELGHSIPSEGFADGLPNDLALTEGLATWAAGKYWAAWKEVPSLDALVSRYVDEGSYLPLNEAIEMPQVYPWQADAGPDCLTRRDQIYSQWGGFVGYLVERYGWEKVLELFASAYSEVEGSLNIDYPTDYPGVLGLALNQLEADWLRELGE